MTTILAIGALGVAAFVAAVGVGVYSSTAFVWNIPQARATLPPDVKAALRSVGFTE